jgi:hypothetical protein
MLHAAKRPASATPPDELEPLVVAPLELEAPVELPPGEILELLLPPVVPDPPERELDGALLPKLLVDVTRLLPDELPLPPVVPGCPEHAPRRAVINIVEAIEVGALWIPIWRRVAGRGGSSKQSGTVDPPQAFR